MLMGFESKGVCPGEKLSRCCGWRGGWSCHSRKIRHALVQVALDALEDKDLRWVLFEDRQLVNLHRPVAAGVEHDHRKAGAVDEIILPPEASAFLIDAEGIAEHHDIVVFVVVLEVRGDLEEVLVEDGLRSPPAELVLRISSHAGQVAVHGLQPRGQPQTVARITTKARPRILL